MAAGLVSLAEYARHRGVSAPRITQLRQAGRIVLRDGRVDVEATDALLAQSRDPARSAQAKQPRRAPGRPVEPDAQHVGYTRARTEKETIATQLLEIELKRKLGEVVDAEGVRRALSDLLAPAIKLLDRLPERIAGRVAAETDPRKCSTIIATEIDDVKRQISMAARQLGDVGETRQ